MRYYNLPPIRFDAHNGIKNAKNGICPNCGAQVNSVRLLCEYCGTQFSEELIPIVVERPEIETLATSTCVDARMIDLADEKQFKDYVAQSMAIRLAKDILSNMDFIEEYDPVHMQMRFQARVRIVKKGFSF